VVVLTTLCVHLRQVVARSATAGATTQSVGAISLRRRL